MITAIKSGKYPFVMCNLAAPDMVGHTGKYHETVEAVKVTGFQCSHHLDLTPTDRCIGEMLAACEAHDYVMFVTSDHGNAEQMLSEEGGPFTAHTSNPGMLSF
jgi:2,3-bisphosphoglycerate-independent phosphoglycerate mutase